MVLDANKTSAVPLAENTGADKSNNNSNETAIY